MSWSDGASLNVVDVAGRGIANVETHMSRHDALRVTAGSGQAEIRGAGGAKAGRGQGQGGANYSHFNIYKRLHVEEDSEGSSSVERQRAADALPAPRTRADVAALLGEPPFMRPSTIASLVLDDSGRLEAWGGGAGPAGSAPLYSWNLKGFFD